MRFIFPTVVFALLLMQLAEASSPHAWEITSPSHEQTFVYGSERHRAWVVRGRDHHLALNIEFTNDPYVDRTEPRQFDNFTFDFPTIIASRDGRTFNYRAPRGPSIPVAERQSGLLGIDEIKLLPGCRLLVEGPHGYLTVVILVSDPPSIR